MSSITVSDTIANLLDSLSDIHAQSVLAKLSTLQITDTAYNISNNFSALQNLIATNVGTTISITDTETPRLILSMEQVTSGSAVLNHIMGGYSVAVRASASSVVANLNGLQPFAAEGILSSITPTDTGTPTFTLSAAQLIANLATFGAITGPYFISLTDGGTPNFNLTDAQLNLFFSVFTHLAGSYSISLSNSNPNSNIYNGWPLLTIPVADLTSDQSVFNHISDPYALVVTGVAAPNAAATVQNPCGISGVLVSDTVANVFANLDSLQTLATNWKLSSITLIDPGAPMLTLTPTQTLKYGTALGLIANAKNSITTTSDGTNTLVNIEYAHFAVTYILSASSSSVNEGSNATFTLTTTNVASGTVVPYTISGTVSPADIFSGDPAAVGALDGKATVGADGKATITIPVVADNWTEGPETLTVTAGGASASTTVNDTSLNVNHAPTVTSATTAATSENVSTSTVVYTATATDPDANTALIYSISGGVDASLFNINSTTGAVTFKNSPNFEAPTDNGANNVYDIVVQASDGSLTATQAVAITVTNVNEPPTFTSATVQTFINALYPMMYGRVADSIVYGSELSALGVSANTAATAQIGDAQAQALANVVQSTQPTYFASIYGPLSDSQFINALYVHLAGNSSGVSGSDMSYWQGVLNSLDGNRAALVGEFTLGFLNYSGTDTTALGRQAALLNKVTVSKAWVSESASHSFMNAAATTDHALMAETTVLDGVDGTAASLAVALNYVHQYASSGGVIYVVPLITSAAGVTNQTMQTIAGTIDAADAGRTVSIYDGATLLGMATPNASGIWSTNVNLTSTQGSHSVTATATNEAGTAGTSSAVTFTLDTIAPTLAITSTGGTVAQAAQTISGTIGAADAGLSISIYDGSTLLGTTTANGSGLWNAPLTLLSTLGTHAITAQATDIAGNHGTSIPVSYILNTVVPPSGVTTAGTSGNDALTGSSAVFWGGAGNDTITGLSGANTSVYTGSAGQYTITNNAGVITVLDSNTSRDGTDTLSNIQHIQFTDFSINTTMKSEAAKLPTTTVNAIVELYVAYFARTPDATGLSYWIDKAAAGETLTAISKEFYNAGVQFSSLTGYSATMANSDFIKIVYTNVLGRSGATAPPDADVAYWDNQIKIGATTKEGLIQTMLTAAHSFANDPTWGWVPKLLDNKISVGYQAAVTYGLDYNSSSDAITQGMAIAKAVTPTDTSIAVGLIGVADHVFL